MRTVNNNAKPKVSIIVPVYNTEKYLVKCLDSLVNQTLNEIEIIVVNDGSTDSSPEIIDVYYKKYPQKMKVIHKKNGGQASARNMALDISTGEYIGFLDSDDFAKVEAFEKLYECAVENDADYVGCGYTDLIYDNESYKMLREYVANKPCTINKQMFEGGLVFPFINFYRGSILRDNKLHYPEGFIYEDTAFWLYAIPYIKKLYYLEEALAYRVRHENSTMTITSAKKVSNIFNVFTQVIEYYKEHGFWDEYHDEVEYFCVRVLLCSSMERISRVQNKEEKRRLIKDTYDYLNKYFPKYKSNSILKRAKGMKNIYIRHSNYGLSKILCKCIRKR